MGGKSLTTNKDPQSDSEPDSEMPF
jgi:hypothetical protein